MPDAANTHTISLSTAYGEVIAAEEVTTAEFASALRRFYNRAILRATGVVVLDGVIQSRNTFLEFVRQFNESEIRTAHAAAH